MTLRLPGAQHLVGRSASMRRLLEDIRAAAPTIDSILVRGETGSGKDVVAREIHTQSSRSAGPYVPVNCASINDSSGDAELFGYRKGAFTGADRDRPGLFQRAKGGTLFLDELGELSVPTQAKLLRALQGGKVRQLGGDEVAIDVRVVAATNLDLEQMASDGRFRIELLNRFVECVSVPPLRERLDDLPDLVHHFLVTLREEEGRNRKARFVTEAALQKLARYSFPGNVRDLEAFVKRALSRSRQGALEELGPEFFELPPSSAPSGLEEAAIRAVRALSESILRDLESGARTPASMDALATALPELDIRVQLARAFAARRYDDPSSVARRIFGYKDADSVRAIVRRADKAKVVSAQEP